MNNRMYRSCLPLAGTVMPAAATELTVMSFNIWGGGANVGKTVDETVAVIRKVNPDIVGIQETMTEGDTCTADVCPPKGESVARALANALGYYYVDQTATNPALMGQCHPEPIPDRSAYGEQPGCPDPGEWATSSCLQYSPR